MKYKTIIESSQMELLVQKKEFLVQKNGNFGSKNGNFGSKIGNFGSKNGNFGLKNNFFDFFQKWKFRIWKEKKYFSKKNVQKN